MVLAERPTNLVAHRVGAAAGIKGRASLVREMPLPFDVGVLQAVRPRANLPRARFGQRDQLGNFRFEISDAPPICCSSSIRPTVKCSIERTSPADPRAI